METFSERKHGTALLFISRISHIGDAGVFETKAKWCSHLLLRSIHGSKHSREKHCLEVFRDGPFESRSLPCVIKLLACSHWHNFALNYSQVIGILAHSRVAQQTSGPSQVVSLGLTIRRTGADQLSEACRPQLLLFSKSKIDCWRFWIGLGVEFMQFVGTEIYLLYQKLPLKMCIEYTVW